MKRIRWILFLIPSIAFAREPDPAQGLGGSLRTLGLASHGNDLQTMGGWNALSQTLLRLTANEPVAGGRFEGHLVQSVEVRDEDLPAGQGIINLGPRHVRYRAFDLEKDWTVSDRASASLWADRLFFKRSLGWGDVTIGRQAISLGKAYFWNPLDVFLPFDPRQFDRDYKPGVDALRVDLPMDAYSGANMFAAPGRTLDASGNFEGGSRDVQATWYGSALLARGYTTWEDWDLSLQAGKVYGGTQLGAGAVGEVFDWQWRAEATSLIAASSYASGVLGLGRFFGELLEVDAEYLFNGAANAGRLNEALSRFQTGGMPQLSRQAAGCLVRYQFHPLASAYVAPIVSLDRLSAQVQPSVTWSLSDEAELDIGAIWNLGPGPTGSAAAPTLHSEFGTYPDIYYLELKWYF